jgi:hypothetical protein
VLTREKNVILPCQLAQGMCLALINSGFMTKIITFLGTDDATTVIDKLIFGLDRYQDIKHQDQTEEVGLNCFYELKAYLVCSVNVSNVK